MKNAIEIVAIGAVFGLVLGVGAASIGMFIGSILAATL